MATMLTVADGGGKNGQKPADVICERSLVSCFCTRTKTSFSLQLFVSDVFWTIYCIQDTLSSRAALGLPAAYAGRVRRASKGILHTRQSTVRVELQCVYNLPLNQFIVHTVQFDKTLKLDSVC